MYVCAGARGFNFYYRYVIEVYYMNHKVSINARKSLEPTSGQTDGSFVLFFVVT